MITLYDSKETDFRHNGLGILTDTLKADVREELNSNFTLELEYLLEDKQKLSSYLVRGNIIKCPVGDSRKPQLFRIRRTIKNLRTVSVFTQHIAIADLSKNFIRDTNIVGKTRVEALNWILNNTLEKHKFTGYGDKTTKQDNLRIVRYNPITAIMGTEDNTLLNRYGGEIEFDNFTVRVTEQRGQDNGVLIAYGKNVTGIEEEIDDTDLATCIIPQGSNELLIPEYCINSKYINSYEKIYFKHIVFDNIGIVEPTEDTETGEKSKGVTREEAVKKLKIAVQHLYEVEKVDIPSCNYRVNFVELSKTEEYKNYAILETVNLGDTVTIRHSKMNIDLQARVNITTYNVLADKYTEIELGFKKKDLTGIIQDTQKQIQFTKDVIEMGITNLDATLSTKLTMTESSIRTEVKDVKQGLESSITQTSGEIRSEIKGKFDGVNGEICNLKDADGNIIGQITETNSKIQQTASSIRSEVNTKTKDLEGKIGESNSKIEQTASSIRSEVNSKFNATSGDIATLKDADDKILGKITESNSKIEQTASSIRTEINSKVQGLDGKISDCNSSISQTAKEIRSDVKDLSRNTNSSIKQLSNEIELKVDAGRVISAINLSSEGVKIRGNKVEISGFVTFNDLNSKVNDKVNDAVSDRPTYSDLSRYGRTTINGGNIQTGTITGNKIQADTTLRCDKLIAGLAGIEAHADSKINGDLTVTNKIKSDAISTTSLYVVKDKNCVQKTYNYGWRAINAYETAENYFGDVGFGQLKDGECKIQIDQVFSEVVNLDTYYHVFLSKYGKSDIWIAEQTKDYFLVRGDNDIRFSWELKAKRRGFEDVRLKEVTGMMEKDLTTKDERAYKENLANLEANKTAT